MYALHNDHMYIIVFVTFPVPGVRCADWAEATNLWETLLLHGCVWVVVGSLHCHW